MSIKWAQRTLKISFQKFELWVELATTCVLEDAPLCPPLCPLDESIRVWIWNGFGGMIMITKTIWWLCYGHKRCANRIKWTYSQWCCSVCVCSVGFVAWRCTSVSGDKLKQEILKMMLCMADWKRSNPIWWWLYLFMVCRGLDRLIGHFLHKRLLYDRCRWWWWWWQRCRMSKLCPQVGEWLEVEESSKIEWWRPSGVMCFVYDDLDNQERSCCAGVFCLCGVKFWTNQFWVHISSHFRE